MLMISFSIKAAVAGLPTQKPSAPGWRRRRWGGEGLYQPVGENIPDAERPARDMSEFVRGQFALARGSGFDCANHSFSILISANGPIRRCAATLTQRFRRYCDPPHLQRPNPTFRDGHHAASRTDLTAGTNRGIRIAIIAITTRPPDTASSSSSCSSRPCVVRPGSKAFMIFLHPSQRGPSNRWCGHTGSTLSAAL